MHQTKKENIVVSETGGINLLLYKAIVYKMLAILKPLVSCHGPPSTRYSNTIWVFWTFWTHSYNNNNNTLITLTVSYSSPGRDTGRIAEWANLPTTATQNELLLSNIWCQALIARPLVAQGSEWLFHFHWSTEPHSRRQHAVTCSGGVHCRVTAYGAPVYKTQKQLHCVPKSLLVYSAVCMYTTWPVTHVPCLKQLPCWCEYNQTPIA